MQQEKKKKYLEQYTDSKREMERLEVELLELKAVGVLTEKENELCQDIKKKIMKERRKRIVLLGEVREKIERLEKTEEKDILVYRHLQNLKWKEIAKKMGYERRQLTRIYNKALEHLNL